MEAISLVSAFRFPSRLLTSTAGVAIAITIILLLSAISEGVYSAVIRYPANNMADLYVAQRGTARLQSTSVLPERLEDTIATVKGVSEVAPITLNLIVMDIQGQKAPVYLYGYDVERQFGGPWKLAAGRSVRQSGEAVVDASLASQHHLALGSTIEVLGHSFEIVGLSAESRSLLGASIFLEINDARRVLGLPAVVGFYLVRLQEPGEIETAADRIGAAMPVKVSTISRTQAIGETREIAKQIMGGPLSMASMVAYMIGVTLVGILRYNAVMERVYEVAAMRAIGATTWQVARYILLMESVITLVAGAVLGIVITLLGGVALSVWIPHLQIVVDQSLLIQTMLTTFVVGLLGSVWPLRRLSRIEPATAFRG